MSRDSNKNQKNLDKNFKLMALSATVLVVLFVYTIFKTDNYIQSSSYYVGMIFLFGLLFLAIFLKLKQDKVREFVQKYSKNKNIQNSSFQTELNNSQQNIQSNQTHQVEPSNIKAVTSNVTFKDIAGIDEIKEELEEVVDFLNSPEKYLKHGIKLPKGVLLVGPPGVGKTLIARAVAGEADVPFFYQSGASFVQIYVGMGAKKVRELFSAAKANAPAIVFIDEIDAVGKKRDNKANEEREATLNELLTQMDGFEGDSGVIVIAATNKIEVLDDALLRAGRFDRRVYVGLPNVEDREKILNLYLKDTNNEINTINLAQQTAGFSSAAIATLINEALLNMIKRKAKILDNSDIEVAKNKLQFGKKQIKILDENQKEILAIYQACKAYIAKSKIALFDDKIEKINTTYPSFSELKENIKRDLAGVVGLEILRNEKYAISEMDIKDAYSQASKIVEDYKMTTSVEELISSIKNELRTTISSNIEEINRLKEIMIKNEVITLDDI